MSWLGPLLGIAGSLFGGNPGAAAAGNQQAVNQMQESILQHQIMPFLMQEARGGMDPAVMMAAQSGNDAEFLRQMNSASAAQGPGYRGGADVPYDQAISDAMLNSQIAGQQQAFKNQAIQELSGATQGILGPMSSQYAQQAQTMGSNPWMGAASALAGGGGDALGQLFTRMFGGGGGGFSNPSSAIPTLGQWQSTFSPPMFTPPPMSQNISGVPGYYSGTVSSSPLANGPHQ